MTKQKALLGSATARNNLARQVAAAVRDRGADGVNLDIEPIVSTYAEEFTALVQAVRAELDAIAPGYQLTFDAMGYVGNYPIEAATGPGGADAIVIMGYDYKGSSSGTAGSIAPIGGPVYDIADTLAAYTSRVPASKLILGVPYYGRAWSTASRRAERTDHVGAQVRRVRDRAVRDRAGAGRRPTADATTPWRALPGPTYQQRELHQDPWLRDQLAPALLRRRAVPRDEIRPGQPVRHPRRRDLGAWL